LNLSTDEDHPLILSFHPNATIAVGLADRMIGNDAFGRASFLAGSADDHRRGSVYDSVMTIPNLPITGIIGSDRYEGLELGPKIIALLAFPGTHEVELQQRAFEGLCAKIVHARHRADEAIGTLSHTKFRVYGAIDEPEIRRRLRTLPRRLRDRMKAAQMAMGYFDEALRHMFASIREAYPDLGTEIGDLELRPTPLPDGVGRHSLNALIQYHYPHSNEEGQHNREQRIWRSSLRVIHVAAALYVLGRRLEPGPDGFAYNLGDLDLHRRVLTLAEVHETAARLEWHRRHQSGIKGSSTFMIDPNGLIGFRAEPPANGNL